MYAVIRRYNAFEGSVQEIMQRVNEQFAPTLAKSPGFVSYSLVDGGDGSLLSINIFDDKQAADDSNRLASEFVRNHLHHMIKTAPVILSGTVGVHQTAENAVGQS